MSEPTFDVTTERVYSRLPEVLRLVDSVNGWVLKTYLSGVSDILSEVDRLIARFGYVPVDRRKKVGNETNPHSIYHHEDRLLDGSTSDLVSGEYADAEWLEWMGQLFGATFGQMSEVERRGSLSVPTVWYQAGSQQALVEAVRSELSGTKYAKAYPHTDDSDPLTIGGGTPWDILIVTKTSETPEFSQIIQTVIRKNAKPAGVVLYHLSYEAPWNDTEAAFPNWNAIDAATWDEYEETGF